MSDIYLTKPQFEAECKKCLQCTSKPCQKACPAGVSPHDFIKYASEGDFKKSAETILAQNPFAEVCGLVCPDKFCRKACLRAHLDCAIKIPQLQAYIMKKYRDDNAEQKLEIAKNNKKIAVIGSGPAGIGASYTLLNAGYIVEVFEKNTYLGGALNMIPDARLPKEIISYEWQRLEKNYPLIIHLNNEVTNPQTLLKQGFSGVIIATGENKFHRLGIEGENLALNYDEYLLNPQKYEGLQNVAIVGGGAVAVDCATTAHDLGAKKGEMFVRRRICDMRITNAERESLLENQIDITTMTRVTKIIKENGKFTAYTVKTQFDEAGKLIDIPDTEIARKGFDLIVLALGSSAENLPAENAKILLAGDCINGSSTAVEAISSGKSTAEKLLKNL